MFLCNFEVIMQVIEFKFKHSNINMGIWRYIVKMRKQKLPQFAEFFYYHFSCYIKVSDEQRNNLCSKLIAIINQEMKFLL